MSLALHHRELFAAQRGDEPELVHRQPHGGGEIVDGVAADHDAERQSFAAAEAREIDRAQIAGGNEVDAGLRAAAQHQAAQPHIGPAGGAVEREVDGRGDVGAAILAVLQMHRKLGEVDVGSGRDYRLHRRLFAGDLDQLGLAAQAAQDFRQELRSRHAERRGKARSARQNVASERETAGRLEQHRLRVRLQRLRDLGQPCRSGPALQLADAIELLDEMAQPEFVVVDGCARGGGDVFQPHRFYPELGPEV
jgi:hypothetical protein